LLRQKAEAVIGRNAAPSPENLGALSPEEIRKVVSELRVHQVELEMQNEELRVVLGKLDASQARYFDFYDLAPVGYFTLSETGLIRQANLTAAALLGVARDELLEQPITRFIFNEDQDSYYLLRKQIVATGAPQACELRLVKQDGTHFWARLDAIAAPDENRAPVLRIVLSDITEGKGVVAALRHHQEMLERTEAIANIGSWEWDVAKGVVTWSAELFRIFQRNPADGAPSLAEQSEVYFPDDMLRLTEAVEAAVSNGTPYEMELLASRKDGKTLVCRARGYTEMGLDKKVKRLFGSLQDVTEKTQREAQRLRDEATHRDALVREVHHRIKNSLQGVTGILCDLAQRQPVLAPALDDVIGQVGSIALVHGLYGSASRRRVSLCDLVAKVTRNAETLWQTEVALAVEHNCPHCILDEREAVPLALVLNELLANACKHGAGGNEGEKRTIAVEYAADYSQARVRITNPGRLPPGFDFDKHQGLGTGLGLVAVLLPKEGASLDWTQQAAGVETLLSLSAPVFAERLIEEGTAA
jgi:PAS domain S-box-containing protein